MKLVETHSELQADCSHLTITAITFFLVRICRFVKAPCSSCLDVFLTLPRQAVKAWIHQVVLCRTSSTW